MAGSKQSRALMIYLNNRAILEALSDAERGQMTLALLDYLEYGAVPAFTGALQMAFVILRMDVDRSVARWEAECARRSAAGKKGAAVRAAKNFAEEVSCENDCVEAQAEGTGPSKDGEPQEPRHDAGQNQAELSSAGQNQAERSSIQQSQAERSGGQASAAAQANTNQNSNQNSNQNQNQNTNPYPGPGRALAPAGAGRGSGEAFERFWRSYPRKVGKQAARRAFDRVNVPVERLLEALERQRGDPQWQKEGGRFIPHPVTWLTQGRWEDEPVTGSAPSNPAYRVECL